MAVISLLFIKNYLLKHNTQWLGSESFDQVTKVGMLRTQKPLRNYSDERLWAAVANQRFIFEWAGAGSEFGKQRIKTPVKRGKYIKIAVLRGVAHSLRMCVPLIPRNESMTFFLLNVYLLRYGHWMECQNNLGCGGLSLLKMSWESIRTFELLVWRATPCS